MPKFEIPVEYLTATIEHLGDLARRYEYEAAAFATIGREGSEKAEKRLEDANDIWDLQDFYLNL